MAIYLAILATVQTLILICQFFGVRIGAIASIPKMGPLFAMTVIASLTWAAVGLNYYSQHSQDWPKGYVAKQPPKRVWKREVVPLDGYRYEDCQFEDVTFQYEGKTPIQFIRCTVNGFSIKSGNPSIMGMLTFLKAANLIDPKVRFILPPGTGVDFPHETQ
jgi:hypothetical protein